MHAFGTIPVGIWKHHSSPNNAQALLSLSLYNSLTPRPHSQYFSIAYRIRCGMGHGNEARQAYFLEDGDGRASPQEGVVPVEVLINLGSLPQLTGIPVVGEMVLANQIGHDRRTTK